MRGTRIFPVLAQKAHRLALCFRVMIDNISRKKIVVPTQLVGNKLGVLFRLDPGAPSVLQ